MLYVIILSGATISANRFKRRNNYSLEYRCGFRPIDPVD